MYYRVYELEAEGECCISDTTPSLMLQMFCKTLEFLGFIGEVIFILCKMRNEEKCVSQKQTPLRPCIISFVFSS